ncbi:MAG: hypothetical protein BGO67_03240 [Alphaproteobacteria bacterium 41-28]|nr:MAG: hypothetical protein BGO67_03240 [Alphaproteobacteria bacterium 41-28]
MGAGDLGGVYEYDMNGNRSTEEPGISCRLFSHREVLADKCKSEEAEKAVRKSDGSYYRRSRVTPTEGRTLGKIDLEKETSMRPTEPLSKTETKLKRIRWLSEKDSKREYHNLMHLFNEDSFRECFNELDGRKAVGADGIGKETYRENLDENLRNLTAKMKRMAYRPGPVRQVLIPKAGDPNKKRPLV